MTTKKKNQHGYKHKQGDVSRAKWTKLKLNGDLFGSTLRSSKTQM